MSARGGAIYCHTSTPVFAECIFFENSAQTYGGAFAGYSASPVFARCTFYGNTAVDHGAAMSYQSSSFPTIETTIIANSTHGEAVSCDSLSLPDLACCDIYGNAGGDWIGIIAGQEGVDGNFSAHPLLCDPRGGDFTLAANSPCLPGNHPNGDDCGLIGALGEGCGVMSLANLGGLTHELHGWPNPFRTAVSVSYATTDPGPLTVSVFDVTGRRVRSFRLHSSAGRFIWDGRSDAGTRLAPGTYFLRLGDRGEGDTKRFVLVR